MVRTGLAKRPSQDAVGGNLSCSGCAAIPTKADSCSVVAAAAAKDQESGAVLASWLEASYRRASIAPCVRARRV